MNEAKEGSGMLPMQDFDDFFENALSGYVITDAEGKITRVNQKMAQWMACTPAELTGKTVPELLTIGGKIYYETHLSPLLRLQGFFDEIALELASMNQQKFPVLLNALERRNERGETLFTRFTFFKATDRRTYEENLKESNTNLEIGLANAIQVTGLREQLIGILGHDLRNPLGSIISATSVLSRSTLADRDMKMVNVIARSSARMGELIHNIMDFARTRLGEGIIVNRQLTLLEPVLGQVIEELKTIYPARQLVIEFDLPVAVLCDGPRIAQLFSNLLANAITHGFPDTPIFIRACCDHSLFELSVTNSGHPIPPEHSTRLFEPFTRDEFPPSQSGLGLGLYIVAQIAKAHKGEVNAESNKEKTTFTFRVPKSP